MTNDPANFLARLTPRELLADMPAATPRTEYVALLQQLRETRRELERERELQARTEDRIWAVVAERVHERVGPETVMIDQRSEIDEPGGAFPVAAAFRALLEEQGIEIVHATGRRMEELSPEQFEVLATEITSHPENDGVISRTFRPLILRHKRVVRLGAVIVLTHPSPTLETTP